MKKYLITSNYKFEIEAENPEEAIEKYQADIEDYYGSNNETLLNVLVESLEAKTMCSKCGILASLPEEEETGLCVQCENNKT